MKATNQVDVQLPPVNAESNVCTVELRATHHANYMACYSMQDTDNQLFNAHQKPCVSSRECSKRSQLLLTVNCVRPPRSIHIASHNRVKTPTSNVMSIAHMRMLLCTLIFQYVACCIKHSHDVIVENE